MFKLKKQFWKHMGSKTVLVLLALFSFQIAAFGQGGQVTGTVYDEAGGTLPGVNVVIRGTTVGTITDINGSYTIGLTNNANELVFSFVGYTDQNIQIGNQSVINVTLLEDVLQLDEVVAIGYGVQKKSLNTGANLNVKGDDIQRLNTTSTMDALQGVSPGVTITRNNGVPGSGSKVYIRGIGTIGNSAPLYIVDGIAVGNIDYLSPADIESIDVLKDAASAAIYGSRAANGVILVTTKKGSKKGKPVVAYDMYYGKQQVFKYPDLLNAQDYVAIMNESAENSKLKPYDWAKLVPHFEKIESGEWQGTNWFKEIENKDATLQSHSLNVTGGTAQSIYSLGFSYLKEEGILGKQVNSDYERFNLRLNTEHVLINNGIRDILKLGQNLTFTNAKPAALRTGNIYWNDLHNMLITNPLLPVYDEDGNYHRALDWSNTEVNPIASMENFGKWNVSNNNTIVANAFLEIEPLKSLVLRSSFGSNVWFGSSRQWIPAFDLGPRDTSPRDQVNHSMYQGYSWTLTNTISYSFDINSIHRFNFVAGNELMKTARSESISGHNENSIFGDFEHAYLTNTPTIDETFTKMSSEDNYGGGLMSYFGRASYDFRETYLFTAVIRADGSSNFAEGHRWGTFPSFSAGWIITNESFMANTSNWLDFLKLRASWGQNGNQSIPNFNYLSTLSYSQANYFFGTDKTVRQLGAYPARVPNPAISWETSEQINIGIDMYMLRNKLQLNFDLYQKNTRDWLVRAPVLASWGTAAPYINGGEIMNKGFEIVLKYQEKIAGINYSITGSYAHNINEVVDIANDEKIIHGQTSVLSQGTGEMYRAQVGYPVGYFWGYKTDGILQNEAEAAAWVGPEGKTYFPNQMPGDVRFVDQNNDGKIDNDDKVMIGNPNPKHIFGLQFNADYKGLYVQLTATGQAGHQVAKSFRSFADSPKQNYTYYDLNNRWHGEGTSNRMPRILASAHRNAQYVSDLYIEDADFLRISNLTIGYDLGYISALRKSILNEARIYLTAKNLHTFTKYSGMDPEVGYGPDSWASGIDLGLYPSSQTFLFGISVKF
jgi:TonB-dependent starch-binding outer membrane protein SusC